MVCIMNLQRVTATLLSIFLLISLSGIFAPAFAQSTTQANSQSAGKKNEPRKQSLTFEDELVEGSTQKPELFYLFQKKNFNYKRLIKLRENFIPEMRRTSEDVVKKTER